MPDMRGLIVIYAVLWAMVLVGTASVAFNCYLAVAGPRIGRAILIVDLLVSSALGAFSFLLGFSLDPNGPYDKNWWCIVGGVVLLAASAAGCCRSLGKSMPRNRRNLLWIAGVAAVVGLIVLFWFVAKTILGPWGGQ